MNKKIALYTLGGLIAAFGIIQLIPVGFNNPPVVPEQDFLIANAAPENIRKVVRNSCYDCHSHESKYPWYSKVAPVSWMLKHHIDDGRKHLNFSTWTTYTPKRMDHKLEEFNEAITEGWMPMDKYLWMHKDAVLSPDEKNTLSNWVKEVRAKVGYVPEKGAKPKSDGHKDHAH